MAVPISVLQSDNFLAFREVHRAYFLRFFDGNGAKRLLFMCPHLNRNRFSITLGHAEFSHETRGKFLVFFDLLSPPPEFDSEPTLLFPEVVDSSLES